MSVVCCWEGEGGGSCWRVRPSPSRSLTFSGSLTTHTNTQHSLHIYDILHSYIVAARSSIIALKAGPTHGSWGERWKLEKALWRLWVFDWGHYISRWWGSLFSRKAAVAAIAN